MNAPACNHTQTQREWKMAMRYVSHPGGQQPDACGDFCTEDAAFDVNGAVHRGRQAIISRPA